MKYARFGVGQVTWFMAALSLDARRVSQERLDVAPWLVRDGRGFRYCTTINIKMRPLDHSKAVVVLTTAAYSVHYGSINNRI